jgi:chromosomal replication initiator protein
MNDTADTKKMWESILTSFEMSVSKPVFSTWFKDTYIAKIEDGIAYLSVPSVFTKDWLFGRYHKQILKGIRENNEAVRALEYVIEKREHKEKAQTLVKKPPASPTSELPLEDFYINKEDNLNPRYTFDSFVVGPFNELAYAASQAIIHKPGTTYNPFFVYGGTGHGKTHLIQSIGNYIKSTYPGKKVYYVSSEKFTIDYVNAMQANKINQFKEKYRKYDAFIMDDIQFLSNKEKTQEELFHLFNYLYENQKQIIFSSDKHPNFIPDLADRLKSRFGSGMIVDLPYPEYESRLAILRAKAGQKSFHLPQEAAEYLAANIEGNIRDLEGVLNSIICQAELKGKDLGLIDIKNLIKNTAKPKKNISVKEIIKIVADFYNIEENSIYDKTRKKEVVRPRQIVMYLLREDCNISYPSIGQKLGGRDHTTVIHSCEKIKEELRTDAVLGQELTKIRALL